jgi:hypothetical protein
MIDLVRQEVEIENKDPQTPLHLDKITILISRLQLHRRRQKTIIEKNRLKEKPPKAMIQIKAVAVKRRKR